ncbi:uncharacterized protein LOC129915751 [Episyrphus balteatus]|uniref:uncharacterized protein LOC129915751 n=1 Tax=Episyrphus balteatus TaxID=286459 RepID=UPI002485246D|nr:uncharacterized protein LOC129915751 [Episyrphus balteatus]
MADIEETKNWILNTVWPEILKGGKLNKCSKNSEKLSENNEFTVLDVIINPISIEEAFMLTSCYRVRIDYTCNGETKSLSLVAKRTPIDITPENYEAVNFDSLFQNEVVAYNEIIPTLMNLSEPNKSEISLPTYFYSNITETEASIVLGDFKEDGFQLSPTRFNLSLEHILRGVEHIGFFHGLCYALKELNKKKFDHIVSLAKESRYVKPPPETWDALGPITIERLTQATDKFYPEFPKDFQDKLKQLLTSNYEYSKKRVQPIEPYATLCHGDYLRNNIAFAYEDYENPTVPKKAMMFDFQTLRYSSPMVDLTTFLNISAGKDVRVPHFDEIFDTYHKKLILTFEEQTRKEIPEFMSKPNMLKEYVRYLPYSLSIASFFLPNMHEPNNLFATMLGDFDLEKLRAGLMALGGDSADMEIASLQKELYEFAVKENINIFE